MAKSINPQLDAWEPVDQTLPRLVIIVHSGDISLLIRSLQSLLRSNETVPPLALVGDSDTACELLKRHFTKPSEHVRILHWTELSSTLTPWEQNFVEVWSKSQPWGGYAKKFAITLAACRRENILLSDADVLWTGPLLQKRRDYFHGGTQMLVGCDYAPAFDRSLAEALEEGRILSGTPVNCGFVYYPKAVLDHVFDHTFFSRLMDRASRATCHFEQTLIAFAFWQLRGGFFQKEEVVTTTSDNFSYQKKARGLVRHYAGCKHLFWRDA